MERKELFKKVRLIQIKSKKAVDEIFAGQYYSIFKGQGIEFEEVREYQPGDDVKTIDWKVSARYGKLFVKKFVEERELTVYFIVDLSSSESFGSTGALKSELSAELTALLAFSAIQNNDKVGLLIFTDRPEKFIKASKGKKHVLRIIREILEYKPSGKRTSIFSALDYFIRVAKRKSIVFLISDFMDTGFNKILRILAKKHDLICIIVRDPLELTFPSVGLIKVKDAETGEEMLLDTSNNLFTENYKKLTSIFYNSLIDFFKKNGIDYIIIETGKDYIKPLLQFFRKRSLRIRVR